MAKKATWFGALYRRDRMAALRTVLEEIERVGGNIARLAHALNFERRYFYRILHRDGDILWPAIDRARLTEHRRAEERRRLLENPWHPTP